MSFAVAGLCSGISMMEYAAERLGGRTVMLCEADEFCQRVLSRRHPDVPLYPDVHEARGGDAPEPIDVLVFGFP
jgi:site-specific DNA-cytosine methylase